MQSIAWDESWEIWRISQGGIIWKILVYGGRFELLYFHSSTVLYFHYASEGDFAENNVGILGVSVFHSHHLFSIHNYYFLTFSSDAILMRKNRRD